MFASTDYDPRTGRLLPGPVEGFMFAEYVALAAQQRRLASLNGKATRSPEYIVIPKPDDYDGPCFVVEKGGKRRLTLRYKEPARG